MVADIPQDINLVKYYFHRWDYWVLTDVDELTSLRVGLGFVDGLLSKIRSIGSDKLISLDNWRQGASNGADEIKLGDPYAIVYEKLLKISHSHPKIKVQAANLSRYRLPELALCHEFYLVKNFNNWNLRVSPNFLVIVFILRLIMMNW